MFNLYKQETMKKYLFNRVTILMISLVFASCGKDDNKNEPAAIQEDVPAIIGTWKYESPIYDYFEIITFKADGTFKLVWQEVDTIGDEESGTWMYDIVDRKLTINTIIGEKPGSITYEIIIQGDKMSLTYYKWYDDGKLYTDTRIFTKQ